MKGITGIVFALLLSLLPLGVALSEDAAQGRLDAKEIARIVERQFPGAHIREIELETEDGRLVYEVELTTAEGRKKEIHVNAVTGRIEKIEND